MTNGHTINDNSEYSDTKSVSALHNFKLPDFGLNSSFSFGSSIDSNLLSRSDTMNLDPNGFTNPVITVQNSSTISVASNYNFSNHNSIDSTNRFDLNNNQNLGSFYQNLGSSGDYFTNHNGAHGMSKAAKRFSSSNGHTGSNVNFVSLEEQSNSKLATPHAKYRHSYLHEPNDFLKLNFKDLSDRSSSTINRAKMPFDGLNHNLIMNGSNLSTPMSSSTCASDEPVNLTGDERCSPGSVKLPGFNSPESAFYQYQNRMEGQKCQVCGELAAGFHHGAYVCEACKVRIC